MRTFLDRDKLNDVGILKNHIDNLANAIRGQTTYDCYLLGIYQTYCAILPEPEFNTEYNRYNKIRAMF